MKMPAIAKKLGEMWRELDTEAKKPYVEEATQLKKEWDEANPKHDEEEKKQRKKK